MPWQDTGAVRMERHTFGRDAPMLTVEIAPPLDYLRVVIKLKMGTLPPTKQTILVKSAISSLFYYKQHSSINTSFSTLYFTSKLVTPHDCE